ncbi:sulfite exporter TauE/SafE family protein [archaeon]|nr:sulfite exporter TauE/SafE family protein [archaeon]
MIQFLLVLATGLIAQLIDGGLGMGYGVTSTSLLLQLGFTTAIASATVHFAEIFTTFFSGISHLKFGNVDKKIFIPLVISGVIGGIVGVYLSVKLQNTDSIKPFVSVVLLILGLVMIYRFISRHEHCEHVTPSRKRTFLIGFPAALIDALGGGGWGPITTPALILHNSHPRKAIGSVNLAEFFVTLAISISFLLMLPKIEWTVVLPLLVGGLIVSPFSAYISKRIPHGALGILVGFTIVILSLRTILKSLGIDFIF